jgi:hypothetical protein
LRIQNDAGIQIVSDGDLEIDCVDLNAHARHEANISGSARAEVSSDGTLRLRASGIVDVDGSLIRLN